MISSAARNPAVDLFQWTPSKTRVQSSELFKFQQWLTSRGVHTVTYQDLHRWSVENLETFWRAVWEYGGIVASRESPTVLRGTTMPDVHWFPDARLNYAENILRHAELVPDDIAIIGLHESADQASVTWGELTARVASMAHSLRELGVRPGDTVAAILPNIPETVIALLAAASIGATWSCINTDFGVKAAVDRFHQIGPKVLFTVDGYEYNGIIREMSENTATILAALPTVQRVVVVDQLGAGSPPAASALPRGKALKWSDLIDRDATPEYEQVPFGHPLWVVYSSGTTGTPKGIVHSHGGVVLEMAKSVRLQYDIQPGDRCYFAVSTSWVLWNMLVGTMSAGATIVTYDGSPTWGGAGRHFENLAQTRATFLGTGAAILDLVEKSGISPGRVYDLKSLQTILSTGSPLPRTAWSWVYDHVGEQVKLSSVSGGTDVASALLGMNPLDPEAGGALQGAMLGVSVEAWDESGNRVVDALGEMVVTTPMPSMPVKFWDDPDGSRYRDAYFDVFPGVWRQGDWITETSAGRFIVHGRSDATINRGGIRMGPADICACVDSVEGVAASMVIGAELGERDYYMPLFVVLEDHLTLTDQLRAKIVEVIRTEVSPRYVPDEIIHAPGLPQTRTGKLMEVPIKRLFQGLDGAALNRSAAADEKVLDWYIELVEDFHHNRNS